MNNDDLLSQASSALEQTKSFLFPISDKFALIQSLSNQCITSMSECASHIQTMRAQIRDETTFNTAYTQFLQSFAQYKALVAQLTHEANKL